jgi:hypothetical protein
MICPLSKSDKSPIFWFFHMSLSTITDALTRALHSVNIEKNIQCCQLNFLQCNQHKQIIFLNFSVFPLFCPPTVYAALWSHMPKFLP